MDALSPAATALIRKVLTFYREHRLWPEKERLLVEMDEHGHDLEEVLREVPSVTVQRDEYGIERVVLGFDAVMVLPEAKDLFAPLPALIALAIHRFSEHPSWATVHDPRTAISFEEIVGLWNGDVDAALLAGRLMRGATPAGLSPSFDSIGTRYFLKPDVEALRYSNVKTLGEVLRIHDYRTRPRPTEEAVNRLVNAVFGYMREQGDWPNPVRAAIAWRELGFVPDMVNALHSARPRLVYQYFGYFPSDRIELLLWSVTILDDGEYWRARLLSFVRALYTAWKEAPGEYKPLAAVAKSASLAVVDAVALALLTEHEPWARYQMRVEGLKLSEWNLSAHETIRHLKECATWDDYVRVRVEKWPGWPDNFGMWASDALNADSVIVEDEDTEHVRRPADMASVQSQARVVESGKRLHVPKKRARRVKYDFDVAVSFAGECRVYVEKVVRAMEKLGIRVFYDYDQQHDLWGKDLFAYLDSIYRRKARYCVIFVSKHYATKPWTVHERKSAQAREFKARREYILPVRMDDAEVPGLLDTKGYLDGRKLKPAEIAEHLRRKLKIKAAYPGT